jgi:hypothetical protein
MKRSSTPVHRRLTVIGHSPAARPRTFRLEPMPEVAASRNAAYRRLAAAILALDVPTLAHELRQRRAGETESQAA